MAEPALSGAAASVRRFDPPLFRAALFAPEPARERLMTLYAYDIELSRAGVVTAEPMIARMRLQWWRDCVEGIAADEPPRAHEVAGPLHALLTGHRLPAAELLALVAAREAELDGPVDPPSWSDARFGALLRLAAELLAGPLSVPARAACNAAGRAQGAAFLIRTAGPLARAGKAALWAPAARYAAALAAGQVPEDLAAAAVAEACDGASAATAARQGRGHVSPAATPAFLPLGDSARLLGRTIARPRDVLAAPPAPPSPVAMLWRGVTGRW